ncbi:MAG TPA: prepilin-type N-terminal cleavage/methylation domain-containing protein [Clostridiaceae bacterium]|nr:prepilin-type N-terminal cleavage/methylation domain-containing protein [Clostridiaceae bacterium]
MIKKKDGFTLIEMLVVIAILSLIIGISYRFINSTIKFSRIEFGDAYKRTDFKLAQEYMANDIKYFFGEPKIEGNKLTLGNIKYYVKENKLVREQNGNIMEFDKINDIKINLANNNSLFKISFNGGSHNFSVAMWSQVASNIPENEDIDDSTFLYFVKHMNIFIYGSTLEFQGSTNIAGENSTVAITRNKSKTVNFSKKASIVVRNMYIDNSLTNSSSIDIGRKHGNSYETEIVNINGSLTFESGGTNIFSETLFVNGGVTYNAGNNTIDAITANIRGDSNIIGGNNKVFVKNLFNDGAFYFTAGNNTISAEIADIRGEILIKSGTNTITAKKAFIDGNLTSEKGDNTIDAELLDIRGNVLFKTGSNTIRAGEAFIDGDITYEDGNNKIMDIANNISIKGNLAFKKGSGVLSSNDIYVGGSVIHEGGKNSINAKGNLYVRGSVITADSGIIQLNSANTVIINGNVSERVSIKAKDVYINGNVILDGSSTFNCNNLYITGNLEVKNSSSTINADKTIIQGGIKLNGGTKISVSNLFVGKDVVFQNWADAISSTRYSIAGKITPYGSRTITDHISGTRIYDMESIPAFTIPAEPAKPEIPVPMPIPDELPKYDLGVTLRPDEWYIQHGYTKPDKLVDNIKIFSKDDCSYSPYWSNEQGKNITEFNNIVIVSKGDINLKRGDIKVNNAFLYAPFGKVTFEGNSFTGIVIARDGFEVKQGSAEVEFKTLEECFNNSSEYPFQ